MGYMYIFMTIVFTVFGQILLKWRIVKYGPLPDDLSDKIIFLLKLLLDPYIAGGFLAAFLASMCWMAAMTKFDLSHAYPLIVGGLAIITTFGGIIILHEAINLEKVSGLLLIVVGVILIGRGV